MSKISRRSFLAAGTAMAATTLWKGSPLRGEPALSGEALTPIKVESGVDLMTLGETGIKTSVLGMGTGTRGGREQREIGEENFTRLVREAYDLGVRYIDTADRYRTHYLTSKALADLPSDHGLFIQTKTPAKHPEVAKADIERFRRELGIQQLDSVLMHCMTKKGWIPDMRPVLDVLLEAKRKEQVRAVGVSCHGMDPLVDSVDCDELDIHLVRINPFQQKMDGLPVHVADQIKQMRAKGRNVIGMKVFGEGARATREQRLESLKYVLGLGCLSCFTIGFNSIDQIQETLSLIKEATV